LGQGCALRTVAEKSCDSLSLPFCLASGKSKDRVRHARQVERLSLRVFASSGFGTFNDMGHSITLNLPEKAWQDLLRAGVERNEAPEAVAETLLSDAVSDPLMSLFGCLEYSSSDIAERHDDYIGLSIRAEQDQG